MTHSAIQQREKALTQLTLTRARLMRACLAQQRTSQDRSVRHPPGPETSDKPATPDGSQAMSALISSLVADGLQQWLRGDHGPTLLQTLAQQSQAQLKEWAGPLVQAHPWRAVGIALLAGALISTQRKALATWLHQEALPRLAAMGGEALSQSIGPITAAALDSLTRQPGAHADTDADKHADSVAQATQPTPATPS